MPMERDRYPKNWESIARRVKQSAGWYCQHCNRPCLLPGEDWFDFVLRNGWSLGEAIEASVKPVRFVLTTAHLDQDPGNNHPSNLKALCSVCHLKHDAPFRAANAAAKRERKGQINLLDLVPPAPAGHGRNSKQIQLPIRQSL